MEYKKLSNGLRIPVIGLGTWGIGGKFKKDISNEKEDIKLIEEAIKNGLTHIDTAELYGEGQTEKEIGIAIKKFDRRKLFITTKVWKTNLHYNYLINSLEKSLKRLQTDYVDLYIIHYPNPDIPIKETMEAMEYLAEKGKIKAIGVSNFSISEIKRAQKYLKKNKIVANQIEYNLLNREAEKEIIPFCIKNDIMVIAYRPLARGILSQEIRLKKIAEKYNKTESQIALNWVISHKNIIAISKPSNINHIKQNVGIVGWNLELRDKEKLEEIFLT